MAVAYLEQDWKSTLVATKERGRNFITAVHVFDTEHGKAAVAFFKQHALRIQDEDGDFLSSTELFDFVKENADESLWDEDDFESVVLIDRYGSIQERPVNFQGIDAEELMKMWKDCNRYWVNESFDDDDDD